MHKTLLKHLIIIRDVIVFYQLDDPWPDPVNNDVLMEIRNSKTEKYRILIPFTIQDKSYQRRADRQWNVSKLDWLQNKTKLITQAEQNICILYCNCNRIIATHPSPASLQTPNLTISIITPSYHTIIMPYPFSYN